MKKLLSAVLCIILCVATMPVCASAAETSSAEAPPIPESGDVWDGSILQPSKLVQKGDVYYYEITKCAELAFVAQTGGDWLSRNYILGNNLILNDVTLTWDEKGNLTNEEELKEWTPVGCDEFFTGRFDGNGYTVSGLYISSGGSSKGLIGKLGGNASEVSNVNVVNAYVYSGYYVGGIVGNHYRGEGIKNCSFSGLVRADNTCAGEICGYSRTGSIMNCRNYGTIIADICAGGIVGNGDEIRECINYGKVIKSDVNPYDSYYGQEFGGIAGGTSWVYDCVNYGSVCGDSMVGGIAGELYSAEDCVNYGSISGNTYVAGIGTLEKDYSSSITDSYERCANYGSVTATGDYVGGITANAKSVRNVLECSNAGTVTGNSYCGGIVGRSLARIENCYNTGFVSGNTYVGGILGSGKNCRVSNCYSIGAVSGSASVGAVLVASDAIWGDSKVSACYYGKQDDLNAAVYGCGDSGLDSDIAGTAARTLEELKEQATYTGWSYGTTWSISESKNGGFPFLAWQESLLDGGTRVQGVAISQQSLSLPLGDDRYLAANVSPQNATVQTVRWESSAPHIAAISQTGRVTAVSPGTAIITVTTLDGGYTASCAVTVTERKAEEYRINGITVRDSGGEQLTAIPTGSFLASVSITNLTSEGDTMVLLAAYTAQGQYKGLMWVSVRNLPVGASVEVTLPVENSDGTIAQMKAFPVASFSDFTSLGPSADFPRR